MKHETKAVLRLRKSLTRGNIWLYVLSILKREKTYAYALTTQIENEFGWAPGLIMGYIVLYKLEGEGLITSRYEGRRKYYEITKDGKDALKLGKGVLKDIANSL
ncbi:MAG: PadR family transcriptional regulator [Candidatus Micrarchaeota archaeon]